MSTTNSNIRQAANALNLLINGVLRNSDGREEDGTQTCIRLFRAFEEVMRDWDIRAPIPSEGDPCGPGTPLWHAGEHLMETIAGLEVLGYSLEDIKKSLHEAIDLCDEERLADIKAQEEARFPL